MANSHAMNDHIKSEISSYLAGELPESRRRQIEAHAASCEKCRNALSKARAKQARVKREALKKASPEEIPNFFWDRQRKLAGTDAVSGGKSWIVIGALLVAGGGYWAYQKKNMSNVHLESAPVLPAKPVTVPASPPPPKPVEDPPEPLKPPTVLHVFQDWKGPESAVTDSRLVVIRNPETWQKLWAEMALKDPLPEVDFGQKLVLGVFAGKPAGTSIVLGRVEESDEDVSAPYRFMLPASLPVVQTSSDTVPAIVPAATHPYLLAVIPRVGKKIRITQKEKRS